MREAAGTGLVNSLAVDEVDEVGACQAPHAVNLLIRLLNERAHHLLHPGEEQGSGGVRVVGRGGGLQVRDEEGGMCECQREGELLQSSHSSLSDTAREETAAISPPHSIPM